MSADPEELVAQAKRVQERFELDADDIAHAGYDEAMTKAQVADLYLIAREELDGLSEQHRRLEAQRESEASRVVFGADDLRSGTADPATHAVSYRDAQDRADALTSEGDLLRKMQRADGSGDALLARACAVAAVRRGWSEAAAWYDDRNPGFAEKVREARERRQSAQIARVIKFRLAKPAQVKGMSVQAMASHRDKVNAQLEQRQQQRAQRERRGRSGLLAF